MIVRMVAECFRVLPGPVSHLFEVNFRSDSPAEADRCSSFQNSAGSYLAGRACMRLADNKMRNSLRALYGLPNVQETRRRLPRWKALANGCTIAIVDAVVNRQFAF
jgi:hypothetical protein